MTGISPAAASHRGQKRSGIALMAVGFVLAAIGVITLLLGFGRAVLDGLSGPVYTAPFTSTERLHAGRYLLMQDEDGGYAERLDASQVQVLGPSGQSIAVSNSSSNFHLDRNGRQFTDVVAFTTPAAGNYQLVVQPSPAQSGLSQANPTRLIVIQDFGSTFHNSQLKVLAIGLGAAGFLAGFVLLLVAFSRQRKANQVRPYQHGQPAHWQQPAPGWYPDPQTGRSRYWDGYRWQP